MVSERVLVWLLRVRRAFYALFEVFGALSRLAAQTAAVGLGNSESWDLIFPSHC